MIALSARRVSEGEERDESVRRLCGFSRCILGNQRKLGFYGKKD